MTVIFDLHVALDRRSRQITNHGNQRADGAHHYIHKNDIDIRANFPSDACPVDSAEKRRTDDTSDCALDRFLRTEHRCHLMSAKQPANAVSRRIASPGAQQDQPYMPSSVRKLPRLIDEAQADSHIHDAEERSHHLICMILRIGKYIYKEQNDQSRCQKGNVKMVKAFTIHMSEPYCHIPEHRPGIGCGGQAVRPLLSDLYRAE